MSPIDLGLLWAWMFGVGFGIAIGWTMARILQAVLDEWRKG